jgi:single-stranded DNA-binding protein
MTAEQGSNGQGQENQKVRVVGRIGQPAQFRHIPEKDLLVGNMSIATHPDKDTTVWQEVAMFGDRAKKLQEQFDGGELRVGQEVEVVGTLHRRERPTKDGGTREVEQIYAWEVKPVRRDVPPANPQA